MLRNFFALGALDSAYQEATHLLRSNRTKQTTDEASARSNLLRRKAGARIQVGGSSPETSVSTLRTAFSGANVGK